jgi:hypothetical protein
MFQFRVLRNSRIGQNSLQLSGSTPAHASGVESIQDALLNTWEMKYANGNLPDVLAQQAADPKPSGICGPLQALPSARFRSNPDHAGSSHADWAAVTRLFAVLAVRRDVEHGRRELAVAVGRQAGWLSVL